MGKFLQSDPKKYPGRIYLIYAGVIFKFTILNIWQN